MLLYEEIIFDGITYVEVGRVASVIPFIVLPPGPIIELRQRRRVSPGFHLRFALPSWLLSPCYFRLPTRWMSPQRAQVLALRLSQGGFLCAICRAILTSADDLVQHERPAANTGHRSRANKRARLATATGSSSTAGSSSAAGSSFTTADEDPQPTHDAFSRALLGKASIAEPD